MVQRTERNCTSKVVLSLLVGATFLISTGTSAALEPAGSLNQSVPCLGASSSLQTPNTLGYDRCPAPSELGLRNAGATVSSPDGKHVYVLSSQVTGNRQARHAAFGSIAVFQRSSTGALTQVGRADSPQSQNCIGGDSDTTDTHSSGCDGTVNFAGHGGQLLANAVDLAISPDGRYVYTIGKVSLPRGGESPGITIFERDAATGGLNLTRQGCTGNIGLFPACTFNQVWRSTDRAKALTTSRDGTYVYVLLESNAQGGEQVISSKKIIALRQGSDGELNFSKCYSGEGPGSGCSPVSAFIGDGKAVDLTVSPDGASLYALGTTRGEASDFSRVVEFALNRETGELSPADPAGASCITTTGQDPSCRVDRRTPWLSGPTALAISPDGRNIYVTYRQPTVTIAVFGRNMSSGTLNYSSCSAYDPNSVALGIPCEGKLAGSALAQNGQEDSFGAFGAIVVSPDSRSIYASGGGISFTPPAPTIYGTTLSLARNLETGSLTQYEGDSGCSTDVYPSSSHDPSCRLSTGMLISQGIAAVGSNVYVSGSLSDSLASFDVLQDPEPEDPVTQAQTSPDQGSGSASSESTKLAEAVTPGRVSCDRLTRATQLRWTTAWRRIGVGSARLRGPTGGYVLRTSRSSTFYLDRTGGDRRRVMFKLDGKQLSVSRLRQPRVRLDGSDLSLGIHKLSAKLGNQTYALRFRTVDCAPPTLTVSASQKRADTNGNISLDLRSNGPAIGTVSFQLPQSVRLPVNARRADQPAGTINIGGQTSNLRIARSSAGKKMRTFTLKGRNISLLVRAGKHLQITTGLRPREIHSVTLQLFGVNLSPKRTSALTFQATATGQAGERVSLRTALPRDPKKISRKSVRKHDRSAQYQ